MIDGTEKQGLSWRVTLMGDWSDTNLITLRGSVKDELLQARI